MHVFHEELHSICDKYVGVFFVYPIIKLAVALWKQYCVTHQPRNGTGDGLLWCEFEHTILEHVARRTKLFGWECDGL